VERVVRQQVEALAVEVLQQPGGSGAEAVLLLVGVVVCNREAARDLQKRVLFGSARHWVQVPGPVAQGFAVVVVVAEREVETSPSDGGGVKPCWESWWGSELVVWDEVVCWWPASAAIWAQMQGVPSEQKPQGSCSPEWTETTSMEFVGSRWRGGGGRDANMAVKSISCSSFGSVLKRFASIVLEGEWGRFSWGILPSAAFMMLKASSRHWQLVSAEQLPQPIVLSASISWGASCFEASRFGSGMASVDDCPFRASVSSFSSPLHRSIHRVRSSRYCSTSCSSLSMSARSLFCSASSSSSINFICSSNSPTRAARLSRKALWAALFCAFRFVGGVSVAGFRPGFGRGGMTHSLLSSDVPVPGLPAGGEAAAIGEGLSVSDGRRRTGSSALIFGGDAAFSGGGFMLGVEDIVDRSRESCSSLRTTLDRIDNEEKSFIRSKCQARYRRGAEQMRSSLTSYPNRWGRALEMFEYLID
jgi:hypothetical protein